MAKHHNHTHPGQHEHDIGRYHTPPAGKDGLQHASHGHHNKTHGLPHDVFGHGHANYGPGMPTAGARGEFNKGATQGGGVEGPIGEQHCGMHENEDCED